MQPKALILGGGPIGLGVVRSLGRKRIPITLFDDSDDDICYHSRYVNVSRLEDMGDEQSVVEQVILVARKQAEKPVLFVSGDDSLAFACRHSERLRPHVHFRLPSIEAAETVLSKERFHAFSVANHVPVPRGWAPTSEEELHALIGHIPFPAVLKPNQSIQWHRGAILTAQGHIKMIRVDDESELIEHWNRLSQYGNRIIIQEFIRGDDSQHFSYVSYRDRDGKELTGLCAQKLRLHPIHGGLGTFARVVSNDEMRTEARRVLDQLDYTGVASVCFKRDEVSGHAKIF